MRRRIFMTVLMALGAAVLGACSSGNRDREMTAAVDVTQERAEAEEESLDGTEEREHSAETGNLVEEGKNGQTDITLTIGDMVLSGYLYDTEPAKSLLAQLPLTVTLNDSDNDFCGDSIALDYSANDVTSGYRNGELAFWTPASNFCEWRGIFGGNRGSGSSGHAHGTQGDPGGPGGPHSGGD